MHKHGIACVAAANMDLPPGLLQVCKVSTTLLRLQSSVVVALPAAAPFLQGAPIFETFWQGRLIPGACVDTLPFIEAIRSKRTAAQKDLLPDEIFGRLRWVDQAITSSTP